MRVSCPLCSRHLSLVSTLTCAPLYAPPLPPPKVASFNESLYLSLSFSIILSCGKENSNNREIGREREQPKRCDTKERCQLQGVGETVPRPPINPSKQISLGQVRASLRGCILKVCPSGWLLLDQVRFGFEGFISPSVVDIFH